MKRSKVFMAAVLLTVGTSTHAFTDEVKGNSLGLEFSMGTQGILSFEEIGVRLPMIGESFFIEVKARLLSSLTWATFINMQTGDTVSFHPDAIGGVVSFGGVSPMIHDMLRMYGQSDILLGYSFMPWDSAIYGVGNLIGENLTFAIWGCFGLELFTAKSLSVFLDAGGGFKTVFGDKQNLYVVASSWLGSGFGIKMGMRFYLGRGRA
jgi:hypothetical protein